MIVTDDQDTSKRVAKQIADETAMISTADIDSLVDFVKSKRIDGAFCGPSESNIRNLISLCERAGLPCYATSELWDRCSNKESFKAYCRRNNVPTAPEYEIDLFRSEGRDGEVEYPVIVKPVDGCSSKGISICNCREDVLLACDFALQNSSRKRAVIERYIDNGGRVFSVRYLMRDGEYRPYLTLDTYVVDPIHRRYLISGFFYAPSSLTDRYLSSLDERVQNMFHDMGLMNGTGVHYCPGVCRSEPNPCRCDASLHLWGDVRYHSSTRTWHVRGNESGRVRFRQDFQEQPVVGRCAVHSGSHCPDGLATDHGTLEEGLAMRKTLKRISDVGKLVFGYGIMMTLFVGGLTFFGYLVALLVGGETAGALCAFIYKQVVSRMIYATTCLVLLGLATMYLAGEKALTPNLNPGVRTEGENQRSSAGMLGGSM